ncbi:MAG: type I polyketide synthase, partial [Cyanobacteriota bacterium]
METVENFDSVSELDIAVIGMSGRFPGAKNIQELWQNLREGVESISFFSDRELESAGVDTATLRHPNYVKAAPVLDDVDLFDASFFGYSPKEAQMMDPQSRLFLECAWEALENAGYNATKYEGAIGVYACQSLSTYLLNNAYPKLNFFSSLLSSKNLQIVMATAREFLPTRVSYKLNLKGPSLNVQTACSSSLVAIHLARQSLLMGECNMALVGGVSIYLPQNTGYLYEEGMMLSPDGRCRAFDAKAKGTIFGRGLGVVLLKPLTDAIADRDCIQAVIKGTAINNDGSVKIGYTAPSVRGQAEVIAEAIANAGVEAGTIGYVEAHGTGTAQGDPIEIAGLTQAFSLSTQKKGFCAIGSIKPNIGHLDVAAGITGLIKTVLMLKHKLLVPTLHYEKPNPQIDFANSPFYVNTKLQRWQTNGTPRRAGVSAFGVGGTNAHAILEEAPELAAIEVEVERPLHILSLSAKSDQALKELAARYETHLASHPSQSIGDVCFTANVGRVHFDCRLSVVAESPAQMGDRLAAFVAGKTTEGVLSAPAGKSQPKIAFLFTGQGSQYVGMGRQLYETQLAFREAIDQCDELLRPYLEQPLLSVLYPEPGATSPIDETACAQPALFAIEYALAQLWRSWGVEPAVVMGHSLGEYVAACVAGVFSLEDALKLVAQRGRLMQALPPGGEMVAVFACEALVADAVRPYKSSVAIAALN